MTDSDNKERAQEAVRALVADQWDEKYDRPRGLLTDTDRRFLWGIKEYEHEQTASHRRRQIRERVEHGILDLFYTTMLEEADRNQVFEALEEAESGSLESAVGSFIEFLYLGLDKDREAIENMVSHGIHNAESEPGRYGPYEGGIKEVNVDIEVDFAYDADEIYERYQSESAYQLTPAEIGVLVREGMLDEEDLALLSGEADHIFDPANSSE